jgi:hypothetical protein
VAALGAALVRVGARVRRAFADAPDEVALRALFAVMLATTAGLLAVDLSELSAVAPVSEPSAVPATPATTPSALPEMRRAGGPSGPLPPFDERLRAPMTFDLGAGGRLLATGTITRGTAQAFAAEIAKRGSYVTTVVLSSPGGSVSDALSMGRLIRDKSFATEVEAGHYCASSCPLVFAGGSTRRAGENAAIGVHQVSTIAKIPLPSGEGMQDAQIVSAVCQRYLHEMGVDPDVWIHAMETPSERLFYFRPDELLNLKLATEVGGKPPRTAEISGTTRSH